MRSSDSFPDDRSGADTDLFGHPVSGTVAGGTETSPSGLRVEVALPIPIDRTFTYHLDGETRPEPGTRVLVPFSNRPRIGWIVGPGEEGTIPGLRSVLAVLDETPTVTGDLLRLAEWMADYYLVPLGIALRSVLPALLSDPGGESILLADPPPPGWHPRTDAEARIVAFLRERGRPASPAALRRALGIRNLWPSLRSLHAAGIVRHELRAPRTPAPSLRRTARLLRWLGTLDEREELGRRAPRALACYEAIESAGGEMDLVGLEALGFARGIVGTLVRREIAEVVDVERLRDPFADRPAADDGPPPVPTPSQRRAIDRLVAAIDRPERKPFLLFGITGSGKTLVYLEFLAEVLAQGKGAIVLVPEIALTPQTVERFRGRFGDTVAVLHSGLSDGERYDAWRSLRDGTKRIAVGARSALFAPVADLGAIVVDEEHDGGYKQSEAPRYHARDLAVLRAARGGAVCLLGSATPSLESWSNAEQGRYERLDLPDRPTGSGLPTVTLFDLRSFRPGRVAVAPSRAASGRRSEAAAPPGAPSKGAVGEGGLVLSPPLLAAVSERLVREEQVVLLLNRRGYAATVRCRECEDVRACADCSVPFTLHRATRRLLCHHCGAEEPIPTRCARCGSGDLSHRGLGTQQVEEIVADAFPTARIARMDFDTTTGKWAHHDILTRVGKREVDILLGTQMIAKGLDFPRVTLVGVINADVGIHLPDFRATERTFQLLAQVAGRAGRGAWGGEVLVQTAIPDQYALQAAVHHDYEGFAAREIEERRSTGLPPFTRLARVLVSAEDPGHAVDGIEAAAGWFRDALSAEASSPIGEVGTGVTFTSPLPAPIERLQNRWRWHLLLRSPSPGPLGRILRAFQERFRPPHAGHLRLSIDRDPIALL